MDKIKVLMLAIHYPLSMSRYFERAMRRNSNIDLKTVGPFTGTWIPWMGGMNLPMKYAIPPDMEVPFRDDIRLVDYEFIKTQLGDWKPDLVISVDAGINWNNKPQDGMVITIGTDPHVGEQLNYPRARKISDFFFNMQLCYSEEKDNYLPYAYDPTVHFPTDCERDTDAVLIGMPYTHVPRAQWIEDLRKHGVSVIAENGPIFDEYRELANRARIGLNWASERDLNARFFETPAFGLCMVSNRVPDAHIFLEEDKDYLAFSTLPEAIEKVMWAKNNPIKAREVAWNGYKKIAHHTYDERVRQILKETGFA